MFQACRRRESKSGPGGRSIAGRVKQWAINFLLGACYARLDPISPIYPSCQTPSYGNSLWSRAEAKLVDTRSK
ncbi:hypothetical protein BDV39DRAFT_178763, partial [Aspergillus sergii]